MGQEDSAGAAFDTVIEDAIEAARCVVVLWSRASVESEWVRSEASEGKRRGILVPGLLEPVDAPLAFRLLNGADLSQWESGTTHAELDRLTERITEIIKRAGARDEPRAPPPLPPPPIRKEQVTETARPWDPSPFGDRRSCAPADRRHRVCQLPGWDPGIAVQTRRGCRGSHGYPLPVWPSRSRRLALAAWGR